MTNDHDAKLEYQVSLFCKAALNTDNDANCEYARGLLDGIAMTLGPESVVGQRARACSTILRKGSFGSLDDQAQLDTF
jgi:hypothetical protein